jgi:hypothetical protein
MSNVKRLRKHLLVDPKIQGTLVIRVLLYWALGLIGMMMMLLFWRTLVGPAGRFHSHFDEMWFYYEPALVASALLLPLVVMDVLRFTNRMIGPLVRVRRAMRALARGEYVEPVEFRGSDYWKEIADEFNAVRQRVLASGAAVPASLLQEKTDANAEEVAAVG